MSHTNHNDNYHTEPCVQSEFGPASSVNMHLPHLLEELFATTAVCKKKDRTVSSRATLGHVESLVHPILQLGMCELPGK